MRMPTEGLGGRTVLSKQMRCPYAQIYNTQRAVLGGNFTLSNWFIKLEITGIYYEILGYI